MENIKRNFFRRLLQEFLILWKECFNCKIIRTWLKLFFLLFARFWNWACLAQIFRELMLKQVQVWICMWL